MNRTSRLLAFASFCIFVLTNCNLPRVTITTEEPSTPLPVIPTDTATPTQPAVELGLAENPLILALPPSANTPDQINAANKLAAQFTQRTGYVIVTIVPDSYSALVDALEKGNAHIVLLDPLSYALAYKKDLVGASFASIKDGKDKYGAQFLATRKGGFKSYFDAEHGLNTAEAGTALAQFENMKPCWSDETSASGYIIPLGFLNKNFVSIQSPAFVGNHPTVVRSLYASGICDFGATYIDARKFPSLEDQFPDLMEQVIVVWHIPEIIPYEILAFSTQMPQPMRELFANAIPAILQTDEGNAAFKTAFGVDEWQAVNDGDFREFRTYVDESNVDLTLLVNSLSK